MMRSSNFLPWVGLALALGSIGCSARPTGVDDDSGTTSTTQPAPSSTTEAGSSTTSGSAETTILGVDSSGSSSDGGIDDGPWPCSVLGPEGWHTIECIPDGGGSSFECDMLAQDCAEGEKCMPWANDGGSVWNATRCSPVVPVADPLGDACVVQGSAVSGLDTCALGAVCWDVDPIGLAGTCVPVCSGSVENPFCSNPDTSCMVANDGALALCLPVCNPLLQNCEGGRLCMPAPADAGWSCMPPGSDVLGIDGDPCEFLNACEAGSVCASAEVVPDCLASVGCCTSLCDLAMPACAPGTECVSWYERGTFPPSLENMGVCATQSQPPEDGWVHPSVDRLRAMEP